MQATGGVSRCLLAQIFMFLVVNAHPSNNIARVSRSASWTEPHKFVKHDKCGRDFNSGFNKVIAESSCKPRPVVIDLISPSSEIQFLPSKVVVNRCDGTCHVKLLCLAKEKKMVPVQVQQLNFLEDFSQPQCGEVFVEEHKTCACMCSVTKESCNNKQIYSPQECSCKCTNEEDKKHCLSKEGTWDNDKCLCL